MKRSLSGVLALLALALPAGSAADEVSLHVAGQEVTVFHEDADPQCAAEMDLGQATSCPGAW